MIDINKKMYAVFFFTLISVIIIQIPYITVWIFGVSFPYDAMTDFSPWYIYLIDKLRNCEQIFTIRQDFLGGFPFLSYFYENPIRFLSAYMLPNTYSSIAYVQAFHVACTFLLFSALLYTFRLPWLISLVGGIIFIMSGINVSLSQHIHSHETLCYFVLLLLLLRLYIIRFDSLSLFKNSIYLLSIMCTATTLARWPHEAVTYVVPVMIWVVLQFYLQMQTKELKDRKKIFLSLGILAIVIGIACIPQLLYFLEMSAYNKTTIGSYFETGRYFEDFRIFWAGLLFPSITGASEFSKILFKINTDVTLGYIFAGSVTLSLSMIYIIHLIKKKHWPQLFIYMTALIIALGFAFGLGSPIHWLIIRIFPPLGMLRHHYYWIKLFYGLSAFGAAKGFYLVMLKTEKLSTVIYASIISIASALFIYTLLIIDKNIIGLTGDISVFYHQLNKELILFIFINITVLIVCICNYKNKIIKRVFYVLMFLIISASLVVPVYKKHFTPHYTFVFSDIRSNTVLSEMMPFIKHLEKHKQEYPYRHKKISVLPVGLDASHNMLVMYGFDSLDHFGSVGNKYIHNAITRINAYNVDEIAVAVSKLGAEYLWVKDQLVNNKLSKGSEYFTPVVKSEMLGILWEFDYKKGKVFVTTGNAVEISHWAPDQIIKKHDGLVSTTWEIDMSNVAAGNYHRVTVPIFNLKYFSIHDDTGDKLTAGEDEYGRMVLHGRNLPNAKKIFIEYPGAGIRLLIIFSNIVYLFGLIGLIILAGVMLGWNVNRFIRNNQNQK